MSTISEQLQDPTREKINLNYPYTTLEEVKELGEAIKSKKIMKELDLSHNRLTSFLFGYLATTIDNLSILKLNLFENKIGDYVTTTLLLSDCIASQYNLKEGVIHLINSFGFNKSLQILDLSSNQIGTIGVIHLSKAFSTNSNIQELTLNYNKIRNSGITYLATSLKSNNTLQILNLWSCKIESDGIKHLSEFLKHNNSVQELNLSDNKIGNKGIKYLANVLKINNTLQILDVSINNIKNYGLEHLGMALEVNTGLKSLNLRINNLKDLGIKHFADSLVSNNSLQNLDIGHNKIGDYVITTLLLLDCVALQHSLKEGIRYLVKTLGVDSSLQELHAVGNNVGFNKIGPNILDKYFSDSYSFLKLYYDGK